MCGRLNTPRIPLVYLLLFLFRISDFPFQSLAVFIFTQRARLTNLLFLTVVYDEIIVEMR